MNYYKIILDSTIIGAITSNNFIYYSPVARCYLHCNEDRGEYISYNAKLYRSTWMQPIVIQEDYIETQVIEITETEYRIIAGAIEQNQVIEDNTEDEPIIPAPVAEDSIEVQFIRESKIAEMSYTCRTTIEAGIDLELRGEVHHFSLNTQDQLNLISLSAMAQTQSLIPYHADGESCIFYTNEEINQIVEAATAFKIYHTTYYNALKGYINTLETIEDIAAIEYGTEIPEEYKSDVLRALEA